LGQGNYFDNVNYGTNNYATTNYYSFNIKYRGLRNGEQLDLSRLRGNDWCGTFVATVARNAQRKSQDVSPGSPRGICADNFCVTTAGCGAAGPINCFRLWLN
jgi:hypothetical protein